MLDQEIGDGGADSRATSPGAMIGSLSFGSRAFLLSGTPLGSTIARILYRTAAAAKPRGAMMSIGCCMSSLRVMA